MINKVGRFFLAKGVKFVWLFQGLMNPSFRHEWRLTTYGIIRKKKIKRCKWAFVH